MPEAPRISVRQDLIDNVFALLKRGEFKGITFGQVLEVVMAVQNDARPIEPPKQEPTIQRMPTLPPDDSGEIEVRGLDGSDASVKE